jgi:heat shock protein HtpX
MIWEQIRSNTVRSAWLVALMGVILLALGYVIGLFFFDSAIAGLVIALVIWGIMNLVAFAQGDQILLSVAGARKISKQDHPRLYNVVEEMTIASGLKKVPDIYIIDDPALNAFSTGRNEDHAAVAITSGLLQKLNRDELQGVMGHEIGHIKNRDILLMMLLSVLLGTIVILAWYASRFMLFGGMAGGNRRSSSKGGGGAAVVIIFAIAILLMILAPIFAQLIYFAVSRRREYLADASSALYTRYPEGLASALEKLGTSNVKVQRANQATAPLYIVNPFQKKASLSDLTATHPPLAERIRVLRSMAGGAGLAEYEKAYRQVKGQGVIPASALSGAGAIGLREASAEAGPVEPGAEQVTRARETSDLMWRMNNYRTIDCPCGTRLRVPPEYRRPSVQCPHCGRVHQTPA